MSFFVNIQMEFVTMKFKKDRTKKTLTLNLCQKEMFTIVSASVY